MMDIKDYLPFYIGTPILICEPGVAPVYHHELEGFDKPTGQAIAERVNYPAEWIKPILFRDIDKNLATALLNMPVKDWVYISLKHGVDIFGLIDAGLAIHIKELHKHIPQDKRFIP